MSFFKIAGEELPASSDALDYARRHRQDVQRSDAEAPSQFSDLHAIEGEVTSDQFLIPELLRGKPGQHDLQANYHLFLKRHGAADGVYRLHGEHGIYGIAIRISSITEAILDDLKVLEDLQTQEEDPETQEMGMEAQEQSIEQVQEKHRDTDTAWSDWAHFDFIEALAEEFPDLADRIDALDDDQVRLIFDRAKHRAALAWEIADGEAFIDVVAVADAVIPTDLQE